MESSSNRIAITGTLAALPAFSHESHDRRFWSFTLQVPRLSGALDQIPVLATETVLNQLDLSGGSMLQVLGQIRSFNSRSRDGRKLIISVYAEAITACEEAPTNEVALAGTLCKTPIYRRTPLGREICDGMLAVPRNYGRSDYLPCIFWGRTAQTVSNMQVGDRLALTGRLQSRQYCKILDGVSVDRTTYEISAASAQPLPEDVPLAIP